MVRYPDGRVCIETLEAQGRLAQECRAAGHGWNHSGSAESEAVEPVLAPPTAEVGAPPGREPEEAALPEVVFEPEHSLSRRRLSDDPPRIGPVGSLVVSSNLDQPDFGLTARAGVRVALSEVALGGGAVPSAAFLASFDISPRFAALSAVARLEVLSMTDIPVLIPTAYAYAFASGGVTVDSGSSVAGGIGRFGIGGGWNALAGWRSEEGWRGTSFGGGEGVAGLVMGAIVAVVLFGNVELYYQVDAVDSKVSGGPRFGVGFGV